MPWFNVDDKFWSHPKFLAVGLEARGLWVTVGSWCAQHLTDGWVPDAALLMVAGGRDVSQIVAELESAALWIRGVGGWQFKDWSDWNWTAERVRQRRERKRGNVRDYRRRQARNDPVSNQDGNRLLDVPNTNTNTNTNEGGSVVVNEQVVVPTDRSAIDNRERFDKFWQHAIRKTNKGPARKAFAKALTKTSEHHLAAAWIAANTAWATWPDRTLIPHPSTWLNGERWDDDPPQPHTPTSKTMNALDRADRMENTDDPSRITATTRPGIAVRPNGHAG